MKSSRINYNNEINFINASDSLDNLYTIFKVRSPLRMILTSLFSDIVKVQDYREKEEVHNEMNSLLEYFWNHREVIECHYKITNRIKENLLKCLEFIEDPEFRGALISIIRIPEFFYISHDDLSKIQQNPLENLDLVPMLSNNKSIFKIPGKDKSLTELIDMNKEYIKDHCGNYDCNLGISFMNYIMNNKYINKEVSYYMKQLRNNIYKVYNEVLEKERVLFCSKISSHMFPGTKSIIEDNFWDYESKIVDKDFLDKIIGYPQMGMEGNFDYMNLAFGLGPDYKVRNVVFTNAMLQNIGSIVRTASKMTFNDQEKICKSPIRTDDQLSKYHAILDSTMGKYKICFDLSKYSDYLLSQIVEIIIDYISPNLEYSKVLKGIQNLPIKIKDQYIPIMFGTGAGIKSNFDIITIANMLMIDFTSYYFNLDYDHLNVVGDDIFLTSNNINFQFKLIEVYTHMNCKVNLKKTKVVEDKGRISFCNRHFWLDNSKITCWNGLAPGLWMKEIYSFNRLNAIFKLMKETRHPIDDYRIEKLYRINISRFEREFKINKMDSNIEEVFIKFKNAPYKINGIRDDSIFNYDESLSWVEEAYSLLNNYMFAMKNNRRVQEMFSKYYDIFPDHPIIQSFLYNNGKYLKIIRGIEDSKIKFTELKDEDSYNSFKYWIKRAITEFGKLDPGSSRISAKDRTSDYFNEDLFWKPTATVIKSYIHRFSIMEYELLKEFKSENIPVGEIYMRVMSNKLLRDGYSNLWDSYSGVYMDLPNGTIARLYTRSSRSRDKNYLNWYLCPNEIFDFIYPEYIDESDDYKYKCIENLTTFISKLKDEGVKAVDNVMDMFES